MGKIVFILALVLFLPLAGYGEARAQAQSQTLAVVTPEGARHVFRVELALTPPQQAKGLMFRTRLDADAGMLFFFGDEQKRSFWMKNTLIPLDMLFIRKDGTVANIHDSAQPHDLTSISSDGPVAAVLEINGGTARKLGISAGSRLEHILFRK